MTVKFGRAALKDIEIASGLADGDQVVLSDMSRWDGTTACDRVRNHAPSRRVPEPQRPDAPVAPTPRCSS